MKKGGILLFAWFAVCGLKAQNSIDLVPYSQYDATGYVKPNNQNVSGNMINIDRLNNVGYFCFDASVLPAGAVVQSAILTFYTNCGSTGLVPDFGSLRSLPRDPRNADFTFNEVKNSPDIYDDKVYWDGVVGAKEATMNATGIAALQLKVGGAFYFGIVPTPNNNNSYCNINGYEAASPYKPVLRVGYTSGTARKPAPDFYSNVQKQYRGELIRFYDNSGDFPTSWAWDFGDGTSSTQKNPVKVFDSVGTFTVKLTATNAQGSATKTRTNYIIIEERPPAPVALFKAEPRMADAGEPIQFTDTSLNGPTSWKWFFGNGDSATVKDPTYLYASGGVYTVRLVVSSQWGVDTLTKQDYIVIGGASKQKPLANFKDSVGYMRAYFNDLSLYSPSEWTWDFDAAANPGVWTATTQNAQWTYNQAGTYNVCLIVTNTAGTDKLCKDITTTVPPAPQADFSDELIGDLNVQFTDLSLHEPTQWQWDFGDGNVSTNENPQHTYTAKGQYNVCLTVYNLSGNAFKCKKVWATTVGLESRLRTQLQVWPNPAADILQLKWTNKGLIEQEIRSLQLYNSRGELVEIPPVLEEGPERAVFKTTSLPVGVYLFRILDNELGTWSQRTWIKE